MTDPVRHIGLCTLMAESQFDRLMSELDPEKDNIAQIIFDAASMPHSNELLELMSSNPKTNKQITSLANNRSVILAETMAKLIKYNLINVATCMESITPDNPNYISFLRTVDESILKDLCHNAEPAVLYVLLMFISDTDFVDNLGEQYYSQKNFNHFVIVVKFVSEYFLRSKLSVQKTGGIDAIQSLIEQQVAYSDHNEIMPVANILIFRRPSLVVTLYKERRKFLAKLLRCNDATSYIEKQSKTSDYWKSIDGLISEYKKSGFFSIF